MTTSTAKTRRRSFDARLARISHEIDEVAKRAAASQAEVRAIVQRRVDQLRQREERARAHLREQAHAGRADEEAYTAELAWDLDELEVELDIAYAELDAGMTADAVAFDAAVQGELDAWNDWIGLTQAKAARGSDAGEQAEATMLPVQQRWTAATGRLHQFRASDAEVVGQARDGVEQAMADLREVADETAFQVRRQGAVASAGTWPVPTASRVRGTRREAGAEPVWLAGRRWPSPGWTIAFGVLTVIAGAIVLAWPGPALIVLGIVFGVQLLISGVFWLVSGFSVPRGGAGTRALLVVIGVVGIFVGLLIVRHPAQAIATLALLLGLYWTVAGLMQVVSGMSGDVPSRGWTIAAGVVGAAAGIAILVYPLPSAFILVLMFGILLVVHGALVIAGGVAGLRHKPAYG